MMHRKLLVGAALAGALSLTLGASTQAQEPVDQRTYFTFSAPFELPGGKTLPAGKYTFRVTDSPSNRHIVQVMSEDGKQLHATVLAIPAQRRDIPQEPEIRFMETAANMPPAIRTWWYPGRSIGHEFVYPKSQARRLAQRQTEPVLTVAGDETSNEQMLKADLSRVSPSGQEQPVAEPETTTARVPATTPRVAERAPTPRPTTSVNTRAARTEARTELPRTASPLPLIGLVGLVAIALAASLRMRRS